MRVRLNAVCLTEGCPAEWPDNPLLCESQLRPAVVSCYWRCNQLDIFCSALSLSHLWVAVFLQLSKLSAGQLSNQSKTYSRNLWKASLRNVQHFEIQIKTMMHHCGVSCWICVIQCLWHTCSSCIRLWKPWNAILNISSKRLTRGRSFNVRGLSWKAEEMLPTPLEQSRLSATGQNCSQPPFLHNTIRDSWAAMRRADKQMLSAPAAFKRWAERGGTASHTMFNHKSHSTLGCTITVLKIQCQWGSM